MVPKMYILKGVKSEQILQGLDNLNYCNYL